MFSENRSFLAWDTPVFPDSLRIGGLTACTRGDVFIFPTEVKPAGTGRVVGIALLIKMANVGPRSKVHFCDFDRTSPTQRLRLQADYCVAFCTDSPWSFMRCAG